MPISASIPVHVPFADELRAEAQRLRDAGALGQSVPLRRLFDVITEASLAGRAVKESELALEVFGRAGTASSADDAPVRVYIHRLRKRLDDHYARAGASAGRVAIPRGEYRLVFVPRDAALPPAPETESTSLFPVDRPPPRRMAPALAVLLALVVGVALGAWLWGGAIPDADLATVRKGPLWSKLLGSARPTSVVVGDFYMFGESPDRARVARLIRDPAINSREDLDRFVMANPGLIGHHVDLALYSIPIAVAPALQRVLPVVTLPTADWRAPRTLAMSETGPDRIKLSNVVYVGLVGRIGALGSPLERGSRAFAALRRRAAAPVGTKPAEGDDLAYLAAFPGPHGNRVVVIAGLRGAGLVQAAEIATSPAATGELARRVGSDDAFEAMFRVSSLETTNLGAQLVFAGPLRHTPLWIGGAR